MISFRNYLSLIKFSHTIFAMPFAMIGFFLALIPPRGYNSHAYANSDLGRGDLILKFLLVILCMVFARSAAMAFNRYLDRHWDGLNPRTAIREIPSGVISAGSALNFTLISAFLFVLTTWFLNRTCFFLSPIALAVVLGYSYTKRFTPLCHLILGVGLALAPIGAFLAVTGVFDWLPLLFSFAVICWVSGFDIIYALQDENFDREQKLYSIPAWLGKPRALRVSELLHLLSAACVIAAGYYGHFTVFYWVGVGIFCGCLIYQHAIVKPHDLSRVNLAFMTTNGVASVIFSIFVIGDMIKEIYYH